MLGETSVGFDGAPNRVCEKEGIEDARFHDQRHIFPSQLVMKKAVSLLNGLTRHEKPAMSRVDTLRKK